MIQATLNATTCRWLVSLAIGIAFWGGMLDAAILQSQDRIFVGSDRLVLGVGVGRSASVRAGDLDGDGDWDVVVANGRHWPEQNEVFMNQGRARFNVARNLGADRSTSYACELGDFDGDGDLDVAVGNDMAPCEVYLNDGTGRFDLHCRFGEISSVRSLSLADIDRDGDLDILATSRGKPNQIYLNDGTAHFPTSHTFGNQKDSTIDVAVADLNGDGQLDLVLANRDAQENCVLLGAEAKADSSNNSVQFKQRIPFGSGRDSSRAVAVADFDGDGTLDWVVGNIGQPNAVYFGDGAGGVRKSVMVDRDNGATYTVAAADMNNDGQIDIVAGNVASRNIVYLNTGNGVSFTAVPFGESDTATYGLTVADFDGDGYHDIAVANSDAINGIFLNRPNNARQPNE